MDEFPKKINLFKLSFEGEKKIYKCSQIPKGEEENNFNRKGNKYFSLKKIGNPEEIEFNPYLIRKIINNNFRVRLDIKGYRLKGKYSVYRGLDKIQHRSDNESIFSIFKGFKYRFVPLNNDLFLCIDYNLILQINASIQVFLDLDVSREYLIGNSVEVIGQEYKNGQLVRIRDDNICTIDSYDMEVGKQSVSADEVYLLCRPEVLQHLLGKIGRPEGIISIQRQYSLLNPRRRLSEIKNIVNMLNEQKVFPLNIESLTIYLENKPLPIEESEAMLPYDGSTIKCNVKPLIEPDLQGELGICSFPQPFPSKYPPYSTIRELYLILYYPENISEKIENFCNLLKRYLKSYFSVDSIHINKRCINANPQTIEYRTQIRNSIKFSNKQDIGIIYIPEIMKYYENSPYYSLKSYFATQGIPTQMVNERVFELSKYPLNYTLLNICTAIIAKCGGVPWILKTKLRNTDIIIGISLSNRLLQMGENVQENRYIGFANIFNEYGRWKYFFGTANRYQKDQWIEQISDLVEEIRNNTKPLSKDIVIHISKRLRHDHQEKIYNLMRNKFREDVRVAFIIIDESHNYRCFDANSSDGSLARGNIVYLNNNEILLSTTGISNLKGAFRIGTPKILHITITQYPDKFMDLEDVAHQVIALTKLNWASVSPVQREPVTLKYANRLAYITANMEISQWGKVSDVLFNRPWFI
jgi:hypothetical protein